MKLEAFYDTVILIPYELEDEYQGNIIRPDLGKETGKFGKVVAVGPGRHQFGVFVETKLKVDDIVAIPPMHFVKFEVNNNEYYSGPENSILARLNQ